MNKIIAKICFTLCIVIGGAINTTSFAQTVNISGRVISEGKPIEYAHVAIAGTGLRASTDSTGRFRIKNVPTGNYKIHASFVGFSKMEKSVTIREGSANVPVHFDLTNFKNNLNEVVVSGTLKEISRAESTVPVEVFNHSFFKKNPSPTVLEALQNVNGVRPQLNCSVCNSGDIHINGLEGAYTMVLIDGMPIVSGLATTYGLSGIPSSLIERVEIVKGPASSLYGSEAVAGVVNVITKKTQNAPLFSVDAFGTTWQEWNGDFAFKSNVGKKAAALTGVNYFRYNNIVDNDNDGFTDVTLQDRISVFQKWNFDRKNNRIFSLAGRFLYEDRWGGDKRWTKAFRGGDQIYAESIYTNRWELIGAYQLPTKENLITSFSFNNHNQDSRYGNESYIAKQTILFGQLRWDRQLGRHDLLAGTSLRYTSYTDNTPATAPGADSEVELEHTLLPGIFLQDEITLTNKHKLLLGFRYDHNSIHGNIYTPRIGYKWTINDKNSIRLNAGTGYRVASIFTEDHRTLTGSQKVVIEGDKLNPEQSYNVNLNYLKKIYTSSGVVIGLDATAFFTHFENKIVTDAESELGKIIFKNGYHSESKGISANIDIALNNGFKAMLGATFLDAFDIDDAKQKVVPLKSERFSGTWTISYKVKKAHLGIDYTGNVYSPMRLQLVPKGIADPRSEYSPWWSNQNIQLTYTGFKNIEVYGGVKNLLNWVPSRGVPFLIARTDDPFNEKVTYNNRSIIQITSDNPYGLEFNADYNYAPNQGIRGFFGVRMSIK